MKTYEVCGTAMITFNVTIEAKNEEDAKKQVLEMSVEAIAAEGESTRNVEVEHVSEG